MDKKTYQKVIRMTANFAKAFSFFLLLAVLQGCKSAPVSSGQQSFYKDNFKNIKEMALVSVQMPKLMSKVRSDILTDFEGAEKSKATMSRLHQRAVTFFSQELTLPFKITLVPQTYRSSALDTFIEKISEMPAYAQEVQKQSESVNDLLSPAQILPVTTLLQKQNSQNNSEEKNSELLSLCAQLAKDLQVQGVMFAYISTPIQQSAASKDKANVHVYAQIFAYSADNKALITWQGVLKKADEVTLADDNVIVFDEALYNSYETTMLELLQRFGKEFAAIDTNSKDTGSKEKAQK